MPAFTAGVVFGTAAHHACGGQQAGAGLGHGHGLQGAQGNLVDGCGQRRAGQVLGQQAAQVGQGLRGLGGAHRQRLPGGHGLAVHLAQVVVPGQFQRQHALLARLQPGLQRLQQGVGRPQQRIGRGGQRGQLGRQGKGFGQLQPGVRVGGIAKGTVQRMQGRGAQPPRHPIARQGAQLAPGVAAHARQAGHMGAQRCQGVQGQIVRHAPGWAQPCLLQPQQCQGLERCSALGKRRGRWLHAGRWRRQPGHWCRFGRNAGFHRRRTGLQLGQQRRAAAPQALSRRHLQQQRLIHPRHPGGKAQRPPSLGALYRLPCGRSTGHTARRCVRVQAGLGTRYPRGVGAGRAGFNGLRARPGDPVHVPPPSTHRQALANHPAQHHPPASRTQWPAPMRAMPQAQQKRAKAAQA